MHTNTRSIYYSYRGKQRKTCGPRILFHQESQHGISEGRYSIVKGKSCRHASVVHSSCEKREGGYRISIHIYQWSSYFFTFI